MYDSTSEGTPQWITRRISEQSSPIPNAIVAITIRSELLGSLNRSRMVFLTLGCVHAVNMSTSRYLANCWRPGGSDSSLESVPKKQIQTYALIIRLSKHNCSLHGSSLFSKLFDHWRKNFLHSFRFVNDTVSYIWLVWRLCYKHWTLHPKDTVYLSP